MFLSLCIAILVWLDPFTSRVAPIETKDWADIPSVGGVFFMRPDHDPDGKLLLRYLSHERMQGWAPGTTLLPHEPDAVIYQFDRSRNQLKPLSIIEWEHASGVITGFALDRPCEPGPFVYQEDRRLFIEMTARSTRQPIETYARLCVNYEPSYDCKLVAVLSASGPEFEGTPVFGGHRIHGARYHEVFHTADGTRVGAPLILQGAGRWDILTAVWSADSKYVVYFQDRSRVWIVPVEAQLGGQP